MWCGVYCGWNRKRACEMLGCLLVSEMIIKDNYVLSTFYCLLSTVYYLLSIVYCLLATVYCLLSTVYCLLSTFYCLLSTVYCLLFTVYCLLSTVYCLLSTAYCLPSTFLSYISPCPSDPSLPRLPSSVSTNQYFPLSSPHYISSPPT